MADQRLTPVDDREDQGGSFLPNIAQWILLTILVAGLLLGTTGRWDLPMVWAYLGTYSSYHLLSALIVRRDPALTKERFQPGPESKRWDRVWLSVYTFFPLLTFIVAGLDIGRFHWSDTIPLGLQITGLVLFAAAYGLTAWAVASNPLFSRVARVQQDRDHRVVSAGPYRFVRHPGYLGALFSWPCSALALGSWWALVPAVVAVVLYSIRTALEDRTLQEELAGYADYAEQVRYRLLPGLW